MIPDKKIGIPNFLDPDATEHLPHDHFDVLVINPHSLKPIDLLDLIHHVLGQRLLPEDVENVVGIGRAVHQGFSRLDPVSLMDADVLPLRDQILPRFSDFRINHDLSFPLGIFAKADNAVNLANDGKLLGFTGLKQLSHPGETTGDVLSLGGLARDLGQRIPGGYGLPILNIDVCTNRHEIARLHGLRQTGRLPFHILDRNPWTLIHVFRVNDDLGREAGPLIHLLFHCYRLDNVAELHCPAHFGKDRNRIGIPLC